MNERSASDYKSCYEEKLREENNINENLNIDMEFKLLEKIKKMDLSTINSNNNSINNNLTEDYNKFRMGLLSAFSNSNNNNIIIPIIPMQRPLSNFNLGIGQLWENIDNINKNTMSSAKIEQSHKPFNLNKKIFIQKR